MPLSTLLVPHGFDPNDPGLTNYACAAVSPFDCDPKGGDLDQLPI